LLLLAAILSAQPTHAQQQRPPITYTIQPGDTLWVVATLYYNAPTAGGALYNINKVVLDNANKTHPKGAKWIFPGTVIELPAQIRAHDIPYTRREHPMKRSTAEVVGRPDGIDMADLSKITRNNILPRYTKPKRNVPKPFDRHAIVSQGPKATRESTPKWFKNPSSNLERCARSVCTRFEQLCFFECLTVAKRLKDGNQTMICEKLQQHPRDVELPYEVDEETRQSCAELVQ
jgi:hypothetical protein